MIFAGSALMVYNIARYGAFVRKMNDLEEHSRMRGLLIVPLLLLIFFLVGYIVVGLSRFATLMMAGVLLGGSIFVFIILYVMFRIIARMRETDEILSSRYEEMKDELDELTKDSLAVFRVNLTRDEIEELAGTELYESDLRAVTYTEMIEGRNSNVVDPNYHETNRALFTRDGLIKHYESGQTKASEVLLVRRKNGETGFVCLEANLTKMAVSGDIVAFITERPFDEHVTRNVLLNNVLLDRFDRIAYLIDGRYRVIASNDGKKTNLLLPADAEGTYESVYLNYILPAFPKDRAKPLGRPNPLRLSVVEQALAENPVYEYNGPFVINGELRHKQISFYRIDSRAKYYVMLIADTTKAHDEAESLSKRLSEALAGSDAEPVAEQTGTAPGTEAAQAGPDVSEAARSAAASVAPDAPAGSNASAAQTANVKFRRPLRILLVDDNEINREIGGLLLTEDGHLVDTAEDGKIAVDKVVAKTPDPYDIVLMDVNMPVMNGYEATRAIRALGDSVRAAVPIVALTASVFEEDSKNAFDAGMNAFAMKPIEPEVLAKTMADLLPDAVLEEKGGPA